jgi:hypothetical protein
MRTRSNAARPHGIRSCLLAIWALLASGGCDYGSLNSGIGVIGGKWRHYCGPAKTVGQYCETNEECASGTFCDSQKKACSDAWIAFGAKCLAGSYGCKGFCLQDPMVGTCYEAKCDVNGACTIGAKLAKACGPENANTACGAGKMCVLESATTSICTPMPKAGEACDGIGNCASSLVCDPVKFKCVAPTPVGGACNIKETCEEGMFCLDKNSQVADWTNPGFCSPHPNLPVGAPCIGAICAKGLHCDYSKNKCAKDYAVGASCSQGNECGEYPGIPADCVQGKCVATTSAGSPCYPGPESRCTGGLLCTSQP